MKVTEALRIYTLSEKEVIQTRYFVLFILLLVFTVHLSLFKYRNASQISFSRASGIPFQNIFVLLFVIQLNGSCNIHNEQFSFHETDGSLTMRHFSKTIIFHSEETKKSLINIRISDFKT